MPNANWKLIDGFVAPASLPANPAEVAGKMPALQPHPTAASSGKAAVAENLLAAGANTRIKTLDDYTALDMAATLDCLSLLRRSA